MNTISIAGKLIEDPQRASSASGINFAKIKLAVDKPSKDNENGYDVFEVTVFRDLADIKLEVGQFLGVTGKLVSNNYDKEGKKYYNCQLIGSTITVLGM